MNGARKSTHLLVTKNSPASRASCSTCRAICICAYQPVRLSLSRTQRGVVVHNLGRLDVVAGECGGYEGCHTTEDADEVDGEVDERLHVFHGDDADGHEDSHDDGRDDDDRRVHVLAGHPVVESGSLC